MSRFSGIPSIPQSGVEEWNLRTLNALKQNVELLIGSRGETDLASKALLRSQFTVGQPAAPTITAPTVFPQIIFNTHVVKDIAGNNQFVVAYDANVGSLQNLVVSTALQTDVQRLINDVAQLRAVVATLIQQIRT
jgi:hypothetical protein